MMRNRAVAVLAALVVAVSLAGCGPSLGATKADADAAVAGMQGLTDSQIGEFRYRIESAGEKETVNRILEEAQAADAAGLALQAEQAAKIQAMLQGFLDVPLVVTWPPQGLQRLVGETVTLQDDGSFEATEGLASQWGFPAMWRLADHPSATWIEICDQGATHCLTWVVKLDGADQVRLVAPWIASELEREGETWVFMKGAESGS